LITAVVVILIGVQQGILLAVLLSILIHTRHGYKPKNALLTTDSSGKEHLVSVSSNAQLLPGLIIYRFQHSMYYANAQLFSQEVLTLMESAQPSLSWFCIDATAVDDIDFSAAATLREIYMSLNGKGIRLVLAEVEEDILRELERSELTDLIGKDGFFETPRDVEEAYRARFIDMKS
jgi:MFS superfamily sulfate permease-like transporter